MIVDDMVIVAQMNSLHMFIVLPHPAMSLAEIRAFGLSRVDLTAIIRASAHSLPLEWALCLLEVH